MLISIVCAVPYLRDKDIRTVEPGETIEDKNAKLILGLKNHYAAVSLFTRPGFLISLFMGDNLTAG
jgi:exonuclease SbcD